MHSEMRGVVWTALRLFVARRRGSAAAKLGDVLLFLLGRFQNLQRLSALLLNGDYGLTYLEGAEQALVDAHHRTSVVEFTTVVGRAE
jgi:hypothetical protein